MLSQHIGYVPLSIIFFHGEFLYGVDPSAFILSMSMHDLYNLPAEPLSSSRKRFIELAILSSACRRVALAHRAGRPVSKASQTRKAAMHVPDRRHKLWKFCPVG